MRGSTISQSDACPVLRLRTDLRQNLSLNISFPNIYVFLGIAVNSISLQHGYKFRYWTVNILIRANGRFIFRQITSHVLIAQTWNNYRYARISVYFKGSQLVKLGFKVNICGRLNNLYFFITFDRNFEILCIRVHYCQIL